MSYIICKSLTLTNVCIYFQCSDPISTLALFCHLSFLTPPGFLNVRHCWWQIFAKANGFVPWLGSAPKFNGFFLGPCETLPSSFMEIVLAGFVQFCKQPGKTKHLKDITFLAEVTIIYWNDRININLGTTVRLKNSQNTMM